MGVEEYICLIPRCRTYQSREGCFIDCKINDFIKLNDKYPVHLLVKGGNHKNLKFSTIEEYFKYNISKECVEKCRHRLDCYKEHYLIEVKQFLTKKLTKLKFLYKILIEFPTHPTTIYEISLKTCFEEYLCLIASILILWFGFSILAVTEVLTDILIKIKGKPSLTDTKNQKTC